MIRAGIILFLGIWLASLAAIPAAHANPSVWQATQGDVVHVRLTLQGTLRGMPTLRCFGRDWPVRPLERRSDTATSWQGWIGIDLKQRPGRYPVIWRVGNQQRRDMLIVKRGEFRISRITVEKRMAEFDAPTLARIRREAKVLRATYVTQVRAHPMIRMSRMPVDGVISTPFGAQRYVNGEPRSPHSGLDIAAPAGTPIRAPLAGRVLLVANMYLNGHTVAIGHGDGLVSVYSHLQRADVQQGEWVDEGALIGRVGATGRATGPHLHWGIRFQQARINPLSLLDGGN